MEEFFEQVNLSSNKFDLYTSIKKRILLHPINLGNINLCTIHVLFFTIKYCILFLTTFLSSCNFILFVFRFSRNALMLPGRVRDLSLLTGKPCSILCGTHLHTKHHRISFNVLICSIIYQTALS